MTALKRFTIVVAILAGGTSLAKAQSILPWEYVVAPGVFITRPGFGVPVGYVVVPPGYAVALGSFALPGCSPWYVGGYHRTAESCSHKTTHAIGGNFPREFPDQIKSASRRVICTGVRLSERGSGSDAAKTRRGGSR
jgi:hypothetical protein